MNIQTAGSQPAWLRWPGIIAELSKPRMVFLLTYVALIAAVLAYHEVGAQNFQDLKYVLFGTLAVAFGSAGANCLTGYVDKDIDAVMERTKHRPIPSGRISANGALMVGIGFCVLGFIATFFTASYWATAWLFAGIFNNVIVYSAGAKRRTPWNIILGAPGGGAVAMVGAAAVSGNPLDPMALLLGALVIIWTPMHIWSLAFKYKDDYEKARVPMLPVILPENTTVRFMGAASLLLVVFSVLLAFLIEMESICYWAALSAQLVLLVLSIQALVKPSPKKLWVLFKFSSPYLALMTTLILVGLI